MKKLFTLFLALCFPWLVMLINDNPGPALACLIMQVTLIGWPFASMWALKVSKQNKNTNSDR